MTEQSLWLSTNLWRSLIDPYLGPVNSETTGVQLKVCDLAASQPCTPNYTGPACAALQACKSTQCGSLGDKPESLQLCAMGQCAEHFLQLYNISASFIDPPQPLDAHYQDQIKRLNKLQAAFQDANARNMSLNSPDWPTAQKFGVTAGVCLLKPTNTWPPCDPSAFTRIPMHGLGQLTSNDTSQLRSYSVSDCHGGGGIPGFPCEQSFDCMLTKCFRGTCDQPDSRSAELSYYGSIVGGCVGGVVLVLLLIWRRRVEIRRYAEQQTRDLAQRRLARDAARANGRGGGDDEDEEDNMLPAYHAAPDEGETRLEYTTAKTGVNEAGEIQMHPMASQSSTSVAHPPPADDPEQRERERASEAAL
ncbi:hypothetical protein RI367_006080 [Sorochytrium milnesiophthora]